MLDFKNASLDLEHTKRNTYVSLSKSRINTQSVLFINLRSIDMYLTRYEYALFWFQVYHHQQGTSEESDGVG